MVTSNFYTAEFQKMLKKNIRFMETLEKNIKTIKKDQLRIYVPMHVLSEYKLVKSVDSIDKFCDLTETINISNNKFRWILHIKNSEEKIYVNCPVEKNFKENKNIKDKLNIEIKKVTIEYNLLYDAASSEAKKKYDKKQ